MEGYLPFSLDLNPMPPLFLFKFRLVWLVTADIKKAMCCIIASYDGSELAPFVGESVSATIMVDLALTSDLLLPSVSVSAFLKAITNWLYWGLGLLYKQ